jgi:hypothetical protein
MQERLSKKRQHAFHALTMGVSVVSVQFTLRFADDLELLQ